MLFEHMNNSVHMNNMATDISLQKLMYKIAKAYYEDGFTQEQIGQRFSISRIKVSRLLEQARREQIVQIVLQEPRENTGIELEHILEQKYNLDEVIVVNPARPDTILRDIGRATAAYLNRILNGDEVIGITWGGTLKAVVDALPKKNWTKMRVVQLLGGLGQPEADMHGSDLTMRMAQSFGAKARLMSAPGILRTKELAEALRKDPQVADTLKLGAKADVALVGLGRPTVDSPVVRAGILSSEELMELEAFGAVGDIGLRFIDTQGKPFQHEINDRMIGLTLEQYKKIPKLIGVAGGPDKTETIYAGLAGGYLDVLITDRDNAEKLAKNHMEGES